MCKNKKVNARLAMHFICLKCRGVIEGTVNSIERLWNKVETVNGFCCLEDRLTMSGSWNCQTAVTARLRIG